MQTFSKENISDLLLFDVLADMHFLKRKLTYFVGKYNTDVERFELQVNSGSESFEHYDDLIEWKAYQSEYNALIPKIEELKHGSFQIA